MDDFAHRLGQKLVGNPHTSASLEIALGGFKASFTGPASIALTGARCKATLDGKDIPQDSTVSVTPGAKLAMSGVSLGTYVYLSISGGGFKTEKILGSRSVVVRDGIGQPLSPGVDIPYQPSSAPLMYATTQSALADPTTLTLRFLPGFHMSEVKSGVTALESRHFSVSNRRNRMAIAMEGDTIATGISGLWSEPTVAGAIQIPPDGRPLILMADRQTVGGYPVLGAVLSPDCRRLSQAQPGTVITFRAISETQADRILWLDRNYEEELSLVGQAATSHSVFSVH